MSLRSVTDYYWALRLLCHAWAWAGNYMVKYNNEDVLMMDLSHRHALCRHVAAGLHGVRQWLTGVVPKKRFAHTSKDGHLMCGEAGRRLLL